MYKPHFGLTEVPFGLTPNTQFYHPLVPHFEALQVLTTALASGEGFIKVTGEVGTGKTLICRKLLNELGDHYVIAYLPNPYLTPNEIRAAIASELSIDASLDQHQLTEALNHRLIALSAEDKQVVLLIDEAQMLPHETLEALRLISNLETESKKLMQVVLFGQPELDTRLKQDNLRQLRQRITFSYQLRPLLMNETGSYVEHRLTVSGYRGAPLFEAKALRLIHQASGGIPRLINVLAHKCLMLSYGQNIRHINSKLVKLAIKDTESAIQSRNLRLPIMASILVIEVVLVIWWFGESIL
ncbi:MAG: AAA family ATPase [Moritella sp.]|uniref:ExeA family protein n=1 Tax=Moritella sp. TaxID=78556 RepID=UPI0029AF1B90|nr:AAA family ATPase [Moritella sp.]MDX2321285.1 AAA family ATPase [Moritella sp.]